MAERLFESEYESLEQGREAAEGCKRCDLWKRGTQTVFGEGSPDSELVFVGEQPGDKEDLEGRPFVGPAGRLLDEALELLRPDSDAIAHFDALTARAIIGVWLGSSEDYVRYMERAYVKALDAGRKAVDPAGFGRIAIGVG